MSKTPTVHKGPWSHWFLVQLFTVILMVLIYWLLGFVLQDIGTWPGPDLAEMEERLLDPRLVERAEEIDRQMEETRREITEAENRRQLLKDSIDGAQRTVDQLLEIQRLRLEKSSQQSTQEHSVMTENIELFLANQRQYQAYNDQISQLNEQLIDLLLFAISMKKVERIRGHRSFPDTEFHDVIIRESSGLIILNP